MTILLQLILSLSALYGGCLTEGVESSNLQFKLFTSYNRDGSTIFTSDSIPAYPINVLKRTIIIIEDFQTDADDELYSSLITEYLDKDNYNMLMGERTNIETSSKILGHDLEDFMSSLLKATKEDFLDLHLIAYKRGAEIILEAVKLFGEKHDFDIPRVTLLNPQYGKCADDYISWEGVAFVDVVHTNDEEETRMGDVDFYPNGGRSQPGCEDDTCNALRALKLFTQSINSLDMVGILCPSWSDFVDERCTDAVRVAFGEDVDRTTRGTYYFVADDTFDTTVEG